jgi:DNA-binding LacI/PurR family transcriptional regulator
LSNFILLKKSGIVNKQVEVRWTSGDLMKQNRSKTVRLKDIARRAEISVSAVSMALADHPQIGPETKSRVQALSEQLGYRRLVDRVAARQGSSGPRRLHRIGFLQVGGRSGEQSAPVRHLAREANGQGMRLEIHDIEHAEDVNAVASEAVRFARELDGLVICGRARPPVFHAIEALKRPCVVLGHIMADPTDPDPSTHVGHVVIHDEILAGRTAARALIAAGHRRIAFTCEQTPPGMSHSRWLSGYQLAHFDAEASVDRELITVTGRLYWGVAQAAEKYLALKNPPTAHVVPDLRIARELVQAYAAHGVEVDKSAMVISGSLEAARLSGMLDYPLIFGDMRLMAQALLVRLRELNEHPQEQPTMLVLPFQTHLLPL